MFVTGAGAYSGILAFLDWVIDGMEFDKFPSDFCEDTDLILVTKDGVFLFDGYPKPIQMGLPFATGSGSSFALGAMSAGASPEQAVKIASKFDPGTDTRVKKYLVGCRKKK